MAAAGTGVLDPSQLGGRAATAVVALHHHHKGSGFLMAGWYHLQEARSGSALKLLGALRRAEAPPAETPEPIKGLRDEHVSLVAAYCGAYPDDFEERMLCNRTLHEQPERAA
jgi:hypothetical protein